MEWWVLGDKAQTIRSRTIQTANVETFIRHFIECRKYYIVHFEQIKPYPKVIYSRRFIQHATG